MDKQTAIKKIVNAMAYEIYRMESAPNCTGLARESLAEDYEIIDALFDAKARQYYDARLALFRTW